MSAPPKLPPFKRGDTYLLTCTYKIDGTPVSLTGKTMRAQIRTRRGDLVAELNATAAVDQGANPGQFTLTPVDPNTSGWQAGTYERPDFHLIDIEITDGGTITSSETFIQPVIEDVTR
jgi:hypothetical protein